VLSVTVRGRQCNYLLIIKVTIAFIVGILIAWRLEISASALVLFLIGAALSTALLRIRSRTLLPAPLVAALQLGALSRLGTEMAQDMINVTGESGTIELITDARI